MKIDMGDSPARIKVTTHLVPQEMNMKMMTAMTTYREILVHSLEARCAPIVGWTEKKWKRAMPM